MTKTVSRFQFLHVFEMSGHVNGRHSYNVFMKSICAIKRVVIYGWNYDDFNQREKKLLPEMKNTHIAPQSPKPPVRWKASTPRADPNPHFRQVKGLKVRHRKQNVVTLHKTLQL